jgi:catechol 2,3-dioxygenase-like lactoylglutathione lyase family enzyme
MDWKLEVVVVPVTDVDRAKSWYLDKLGFHLDADLEPAEGMRVVHMTPPGSACSVVVGPAVVDAGTDLASGARLQLVVTDIDAARAVLIERGVEVSDVQTLDARDGGKFVFLADPDGNNWAVQEVRDHIGAPLA